MILIRENSVHLTVQLFESILDGVSCQCIVTLIFTDEMVACKTRNSLKDPALSGGLGWGNWCRYLGTIQGAFDLIKTLQY